MKPLQARIVLLLILLLLLLLLLPLTAAPLYGGTIERLADLEPGGGGVGYSSSGLGYLLATIDSADGERVLTCLYGDRPSLWTFGPTPESAQPIGGACPSNNQVTALGGDGVPAAYLYVASPDDVWRTDGTRDGTYMLLPRSPQGYRSVSVFAVGSQAFLIVDHRLLATDGTVGGTREIGAFEGSFLGGETVGDTVVFATARDDHSTDLWRSDGTSAGTRRLARIDDGSFADPFVRSGGRLFAQLRHSLWVTDGSEAGTRVAVANWSSYGIYAGGMIAFRNGLVFAAATDVPHARELWWSDGTPRGTRRLAKLPPSPAHQLEGPILFRVVGARLLLSLEGQLWSSDGTASGTAPVTGCRGGCPYVYSLDGVELGGALLLRAGNQRRGFELWRTDGTGPGTRLVRETCAGACGVLQTDPVPWRGGVAYLAADHYFQNATLWFSDGTTSGTRRLASVGQLISSYGPLLPAGDHLYQTLETRETGWQLWTLDGTAAGTQPLTRRFGPAALGSSVQSWVGSDGSVFVAGRSVLASDGTRAGTRHVSASADVHFLGTIGNRGIAQRFREDAVELVALSADGAEPAVVAELPAQHWLKSAIPFRGGLALDVECGCGEGRPDELWWTDGTAASTERRLVFANVDMSFVAVERDLLYFTTRGTGSGSILWQSDGSETGTVALVQRPGLGWRLARVGNELFFVAAGRSFGLELWHSDGTAAGTRPYFDDGGPPAPGEVVAFAGALYFVAAAAADGEGEEEDERAVWRLDPATRALTALGRFASVGDTWNFAATRDRLFFPAVATPRGGLSLYATDGTPDGTVRVAVMRPPSEYASPQLLPPLPLEDELLFTAVDDFHGSEPWTTDGTAAGTRLLRDLMPGPLGSGSNGWVASGGRAFFAAGDGVRPPGLFLYDPARPACTSDAETVCLGGRWEAEAAFPLLGNNPAGIPMATAASAGPASAFFAHPASGEPRLALRVATNDGGASVAAAGLTREPWFATVTDTASGEARRYAGLPGTAVRYDDRAAFPAPSATASAMRLAARPFAAVSAVATRRTWAAAAAADETACTPGATTACLLAGRFSVRGHRGEEPADVRAAAEQLALLQWPTTTPPPPAGSAVDPDAAVRVAPLASGGYEVFFAALAPAQGAAVVRDDSGRTAVYSNLAGSLTLVDDPTTFAPP